MTCASLALAPCAARTCITRAMSKPARATSNGPSPRVHSRVSSTFSVSSQQSSWRNHLRESRLVWTRAEAATPASGDAASSFDASDTPGEAATPVGRPTPDADELVLVVGGAGRVGTRLVTTLRQMGVATRVMTRDPSSAASARLAALGAEIMKGDVTDDDTTRLDAAVEGCTRVVACFGAQRISKPADALFFFDERNGPNVTDKTHPAWVNYRGVAALCEACVKAGTVRRLVRVTGMSAGYPPFDFIAVALNAVLSMTIRWQRQGEKAVRALHDSNIQYCVVRPGNLLDGPRLEGSVVLIGHGGARVPAGKVSRDDVAECVLSATFVDAAANATVGIAGKPFSTNGVKSEMSWDPARGMHYKTVLLSDDDVYEGTDVHALMREIKPDEDALEPRTYEPYVVLFFLLVSGIFVLSGVGFAAAAKWLLGTVFKVGTGVSA